MCLLWFEFLSFPPSKFVLNLISKAMLHEAVTLKGN